MTPPVQPTLPNPTEQARIIANVQRMRSRGAQDDEVERYLRDYEGLTPHAGASATPAMTPRLRTPTSPTFTAESTNQRPPATPTPYADNTIGTLRAFGQGATFGFGDELEAGARSALGGGRYTDLRDQIRGEQAAFATAHPAVATGAEIAGSLATAAVPVGGVARAATAAGRVGRAAKIGLATGALYGLGKGEGDATQQLKSTAAGAGLGLVGGTLAQGAAETGRAVARAVDASPRAANALATAIPRLRPYAQSVTNRAVNRNVVERLAQDATTPAQAAQMIADAPEHIPVAVVDAGGENTRQALGAVKRFPGPAKNEITQTLGARESNAPEALRRSIRENTENVAGALGLDPAKVDTRTTNPEEVARAARAALTARTTARLAPVMTKAPQYDDAAVGQLARLINRPSMQSALPFAKNLAAEDGEAFGKLVVPRAGAAPEQTAAALEAAQSDLARIRASQPPSPTGAPTSSAELGAMQRVVDAHNAHETALANPQASGPSLQQLHYLKMGQDRVVGALKAEVEDLKRKGADYGKVATQLEKAMKTRRQFQGVLRTVAPEYMQVMDQHAAEAAPISAFVKGRQLPLGIDADEVATRFGDQPNDNARTALGAGMMRRAQADLRRVGDARANPSKAIVGSGSPFDNKVQNLRLAAPAREASDGDPTVAFTAYRGAKADDPLNAQGSQIAFLSPHPFATKPYGFGAPGYDTYEVAGTFRKPLTVEHLNDIYGKLGLPEPEEGHTLTREARAALRAKGYDGIVLNLPGQEQQLVSLNSPSLRATPISAAMRKQLDDAGQASQVNSLRGAVTTTPGTPRAAVGGAPAIERDADLIARIKRTNASVTGNSATAERLTEDALLLQKAKALGKLLGGKPLAAAHDILSGTYGRTAQATAERLLLGAKPGEKDAAVAYLQSLAEQGAATGARRMPRLHSRGVGTLAGLAGGTAAARATTP